jgi:hypothetical protein
LPVFENEPVFPLLPCSLAIVLTKESAFIVHGAVLSKVGDWLGYLNEDWELFDILLTVYHYVSQ